MEGDVKKRPAARLWVAAAVSVAVIAIAAFLYFWPDATQGNILQQYDTQQGIANGQEAKAWAETTGHTPRWTGSLFSGMPTFQISPSYPSDSWFGWIGKVMGLGLPAPANLLAMMMIGFFIMMLCMRVRWYVALIAALGYGFSSYFIILIGAGHIWKFATLAYIPPTLGGIILAYRGRYLAGGALTALFMMMQVAANHVQMTYYFLFIALGFVLAYLWQAVKDKKLKRWGVATAVLIAAGLLGAAANMPSLYHTYEYSKETMRGGHSELTPAPGQEAATTGGLARDYITQYSYQPSETFTFLIPNLKGGATMRPEKGQMTPLTLASMPEAQEMQAKGEISPLETQYLDYLTQYFGDPEGTNGPVYIGAIICALFLLGCFTVKGPMKWALVALTVLSVVLAWGRHAMWLTDLFIDYVPMYAKFRTVESILVIAEITMPLLGALALDRFVRSRGEGQWKPLCWSFGIAGAFCLLAVIAPGIYGSQIGEADRYIDQNIAAALAEQGYNRQEAAMFSLDNPAIYQAVKELRSSMVRADALRSLILLVLGFALMALLDRKKVSATVAVIGLAVLIAGDLYLADKRYLSSSSFTPRMMTAGPPIAMTAADKQILADTAQNYRVMDLPRFYQPQPSYYHKAIGGYHAAKLTRYQDLIDRHLSHLPAGRANDADFEVMNMLNARYVVDFDGNAIYNPEAYGPAWMADTVIYVADPDNEMAALTALGADLRHKAVADARFHGALGESQARTPGDTIALTSYAPDKLTYTATTRNGGVAVFSEVYFPWGWTVTVDGKEAKPARANWILRAVQLPAGHHTVEWTFEPPRLKATLWIACVSIVVIYLAMLAWGLMAAAPYLRKR